MSDLQNGNQPANPEPPAWPNTPPSSAHGTAWPPPPGGSYYPGGPVERDPVYRPAGGLALWTLIFFAFCLSMCFLAALFELIQAVGGITATIHAINSTIDNIQSFSYIPCAVLFLVWVYAVASNADWFSARSVPTSPAWAVGYFFVPILWYYKPYQAVRDIWKASDPQVDLAQDSTAWRAAPNSLIVMWWWTLWIAANTLGVGITIYAAMLGDTRTGEMGAFLSDALSVASCLSAIVLIRSLTRRQEDKHRRMASPL